MNAVFFVLVLSSLVALTITAPEKAFSTMIDGVEAAIALSVKLAAIYAVWLSVLKMMEATSLDKALSRLLRPIIQKLFKGESDEAYDKLCINMSANMLGMGGVATPAGIKAMSLMSDGSERATDNMLMLLVINATSIQLIPATMIALRAQGGADKPSDIILPTLISSGIATLLGMLLCKLLSHKNKSDTAQKQCLHTTKLLIKPSFDNKSIFKHTGRRHK